MLLLWIRMEAASSLTTAHLQESFNFFLNEVINELGVARLYLENGTNIRYT